jgi:MerR family redox-sensitive transcriptional activator SoxR
MESTQAPPALLAIGDVAGRTGLAVTAVRYYDEIGLITATTRVGGKRRFRMLGRLLSADRL